VQDPIIENILKRKKLLKELEQQRDSKILVYTSQVALEYSDIPDIYERLRDIGKVKVLEVFLNSPGGDIDAAYKFVSLVRQHCEKFTVIVPFWAKSAASLVSIGADEIHMGPISELGPIDPQIKHPESGLWGPTQAIRDYLAFVENRIVKSDHPKATATVLMPTIDKLDPWLLGNFERAVLVSSQYANKLLSKGMLRGKDPSEIERLVSKLNEGYYSHGYAIDREEAREELQLNVIDIPDDEWNLVWNLHRLYIEFRSLIEYNGPIIESVYELERFLLSEGFNDHETTDNKSSKLTQKHTSSKEVAAAASNE
jgi:ATP-dependent protease ClpP protease subunit